MKITEEQIIKILEEGKSGINIDELCRKHGIAKPTYYSWKTKFGGMTVSEAQRLRALEEENSKLKRLVAEYALDIVALKDVLTKSGSLSG
ncbi:MAG: transposase [Parachlamydiaceae bacterium]|nr:MAG: transposase [Parachlamydiaceae bacterium]